MKFIPWHAAKLRGARWVNLVQDVWGDWRILWEDAEIDYQGSAAFLATRGGKFVYYRWSYGSCDGCDRWESEPESVVREEIRDTALLFDSGKELQKWIGMLTELGPEARERAKKMLKALGVPSGRYDIDTCRVALSVARELKV